MNRHIMEPDPDVDGPTLTHFLWVVAVVVAYLVLTGLAVKAWI